MIACDPKQTVDIHLDADADKPEASRPTFVYRHLTAREDLERGRVAAAATSATDDPEKYFASLGAVLAVGLVGWRNLVTPDGKPVPYEGTATAALDALTEYEAWEIANKVTRAAALSEDVRRATFPNSKLSGEANLLIMPSLHAANISFNLLKTVGGAGITIGPILLGCKAPVNIVTPSATVRRIINMTALTVVDALELEKSR